MNPDDLASLAGHLERALRAEFPSWEICQMDSGAWLAVGAGNVLAADTALRLQAKLRAFYTRAYGDLLP